MRFLLALALLATASVSAQNVKVLVQSPALHKELMADAKFPANVSVVTTTPENYIKDLATADGLIADRMSAAEVKAATKLRWVQTLSAGVERLLDWREPSGIVDSKIVVTNNRIVQGPEIADHAFAMLLAFTRQIPKYLATKQKGEWRGGNEGLLELKGKTAVVIGVGGIGQQIATRAWAFGMNVIGVDPEDKPMSPFVQRYVTPDKLDEVLPLADVVFISAPHTAKSHKMVGPAQFERMKQGAFFIAVSRGGIYDANALVKALDSKRLAGAGVDVVDPEPLPANHPLWKFENTIITPHISGRSDIDRSRMISTIQENIRRFAAGLPLVNQVDKAKGY